MTFSTFCMYAHDNIHSFDNKLIGLPLDNLGYRLTNFRLTMVVLIESLERKGYVDYVT